MRAGSVAIAPRLWRHASLADIFSRMVSRGMQEATFLILTALAAGSQHGYGVIGDVESLSGGRVRLRPGTLYTALDRLRGEGLIEVDREEIVDSRLRRYYRITSAGGERLAVEAARLQANASVAMSRLKAIDGVGT
jgi:DNA-binding PadR family transcriptional regulator